MAIVIWSAATRRRFSWLFRNRELLRGRSSDVQNSKLASETFSNREDPHSPILNFERLSESPSLSPKFESGDESPHSKYMRLSKRRHSTTAAMNMTPMIDVVFQLLIFFMTVNQVSKANKEQLELPKLKGTQDQIAATVTINVDAAGDVIVSGNRWSVAELVSHISDELQQLGNDPSQVNIVLRVDRRSECRTANQIIAALNTLHVTRVRLGVESAEN